MYQNRIGTKIRDLRAARNMTQAELGKVVGVSMQAVSKWERGGIPDIDALIRLADHFQVSLDELLGRTSRENIDLNQSVYSSVLHASDEEAFEHACDLCWSAMKGTTGIPAIEDMGYSTSRPQNPENSRFRISTNAGLAYGIITNDLHMLSILPEPSGGMHAMRREQLEEYAVLFQFLSDPDVLLLSQYISSRGQMLFSRNLAVQETRISENKADRIFDAFVQRGWVATEQAETASGPMTLYRAISRESFIFFMLYARELTLNPRFWYLSSVSRRTKPLINCTSLIQTLCEE